jgi:hypothetical protein
MKQRHTPLKEDGAQRVSGDGGSTRSWQAKDMGIVTEGPQIIVERQPDNTFAVYIAGEDDIEGDYDRVFSWGHVDQSGHRITMLDAKRAAISYAKRIARQFGGQIEKVNIQQ